MSGKTVRWNSKAAKTSFGALALAIACAACATPSAAQRPTATATFDVFCGTSRSSTSCYDEARAKCAAGQAVISEYRGAKNRRDLRVYCKA